MRRGNMLVLAAALSTGAPGLAAGRAGSIVWVDLCDAAHPGSRIPLPLGRGRDEGPGKACHACGILDRRQSRAKSGN
jgi:hypothetical protein